MILFSLGTHNQDFSRMAKAADEYAATTDERIVVQTGYTHYGFKNVTEHFDFCSKERMATLMGEAEILVLQGGWGGICEAVDKGKRVVVIPRINGVEHVHDQGQVVRKMEQLGCVLGVYDTKDLATVIEKARTFSFRPLKRAATPVIKETLENWFNTKERMNIKILVATHRKYHMPMDDMYLPVRVGNVLAKDDFGYMGDDIGDNISVKNPYFCELTAIYWAWKNLDADYIGLVHYRRHFSCRKEKWKFASILSGEEAEELCLRHPLILPKKRHYYIETLASHYKHTHNIEHLEFTREVLRKMYPDYLPQFDCIMKRTYAHVFNMFIMRRDLFNAYCNWLFFILFDLETMIDTSAMSAFDARLYGRVSELLLDVWIEHNRIDYKEIPVVQLGDENWNSKIKGFLSAKFKGKKYDRSK